MLELEKEARWKESMCGQKSEGCLLASIYLRETDTNMPQLSLGDYYTTICTTG